MDHYTVLGLVGKGTFGVVSKIRRNSDGRVRLSAFHDVPAARLVSDRRGAPHRRSSCGRSSTMGS